MLESAIVILAPEAEPIVGELRARFDPSASLGVPAHVTLIYPFAPAETIGAGELASLRSLFDREAPFGFDLASVQRFPSVVYLRPEPDGPIRALIDAMHRRFPEYPPYGGAFEEVLPHLTVAQLDDEDRLANIVSSLPARLPVSVAVEEAALLTEREDGSWRVADTFAFGGP